MDKKSAGIFPLRVTKSNDNTSIKSKDNSSGDVDSGLATPKRAKIMSTDKPANITNEMLKAIDGTTLLTRAILLVSKDRRYAAQAAQKMRWRLRLAL